MRSRPRSSILIRGRGWEFFFIDNISSSKPFWHRENVRRARLHGPAISKRTHAMCSLSPRVVVSLLNALQRPTFDSSKRSIFPISLLENWKAYYSFRTWEKLCSLSLSTMTLLIYAMRNDKTVWRDLIWSIRFESAMTARRAVCSFEITHLFNF